MIDAYCVAKYGQKWISTRTIINSFNPMRNEHYAWEVSDPCAVITIGVFDNCHLQGQNGGVKDSRIGKVRIWLCALKTSRVYNHLYLIILLLPCGMKKMGEIQLAMRLSCCSLFDLLQMYLQPMLPSLHYLHPLSIHQIDSMRYQTTQIVSMRLRCAEPPLRKEVVAYELDVGSKMWSIRRSKTNHYRIAGIQSGLIAFCKWFDHVCTWKNHVITILVHMLFLRLVCFPWMILSTIFLYIILIGTWNYRGRPRLLSYMDIRLSQVDTTHMDEEFDTFPTSQ
ncbi:FT-interacting 1-like [Olea europaea subsp. europaea]|uniref:FT-interacting 1-like n=1 Tax=Olea europaea subsp. europaea TaxID=158383 RepID=A0A8S0VP33_OLEEU|nr:FT-interacting 1-like [Olea europaea subsp. europaea]